MPQRTIDRGGGPPVRSYRPFSGTTEYKGHPYGFNMWGACHEYEDFHGYLNVHPGRWKSTVVGTTPTAAIVADGANGLWKGTLDTTSEAELARLDWGDQRNIPFNKPWVFAFYGQIPVAITTAQRVVIGLAHDHNATLDSNTLNAWFRLEASMSILAEVDDNVTDQDDLAAQPSAVTLTAATDYLFTIRYDPVRKSVLFFVNDNQIREVTGIALPSTTVQPYVIVQKDSGTGVPAVQIDAIWGFWERL